MLFRSGWYRGLGWTAENLRGAAPTRHDLDAVFPNVPVILWRACEHVAAVNTAALEAAGITRDTRVERGTVELGMDGEPDGILKEAAVELVERCLPPMSDEDITRLLHAYGPLAEKDYFMGSDFTYDDMGSRNVDEDTHNLIGEETVDGHKCWKLESMPKDSRDIYSKKIAWIRQDCLIPVKVEFYDKMGNLQRRLEMSNIEKVDGFWVAKKMQMTNVQTEHQTVLEFINPKYNVPLEEAKFNVTTLEKGAM